MSTQIAVRLPVELVAFIDQLVADGHLDALAEFAARTPLDDLD